MQARAYTRFISSSRPRIPGSTPHIGSSATLARRPVLLRAVPVDFGAIDIQNLSAAPKEALAVIAAGVIALIGGIGAAASAGGQMGGAATAPSAAVTQAEPEVPPPLPRENAVLVLGATGRAGRLIVQELLRSGRTVVAAVRTADKASEVFSALELQEGRQAEGKGDGILFVQAGVDVTDESTLTPDLFAGVTQVVSALGGVTGRLPDGTFGYLDGMTPEAVEAKGMANVVAAMKQHLAPQIRTTQEVLPMRTAEDLEAWERLDDVIMGGSSSSGLTALEDGSGAAWKGDLVVEGGGFCGARTRKLGLDLSQFDGLRMRVKGDGQTFKFNIKTADQEDTPESTYQATFDTSEEGDWTTVHLPWHSFVPVKRAQSDPQGEPLRGEAISKLGLVLSRFEFNKMPNPRYHPGPFELTIGGGLSAYRDPRPQLLVISSAGVERNAIIGDDAEARKKDIPIVQLNPGGVLNWKFEAECVARASGFPYSVVRCTGLDDGSAAAAEPRLLEADQGDSISGKVSRAEVALVVAAALASPDAANKTFELRRNEAVDAKGKTTGPRQLTRLFLKLALDSHRWRVGLQPFPRAVPPPAPPTEERKAEILADPRVQEVRDRQQRARVGLAPEGQQEGGGNGDGAAAAAGEGGDGSAKEASEAPSKELVSSKA